MVNAGNNPALEHCLLLVAKAIDWMRFSRLFITTVVSFSLFFYFSLAKEAIKK